MLGTIVHDQLGAILANGFQISATHDERNIFTSQCQLDANVTTDCACSYNSNFHDFYLATII
ncbi:hypothetical protein D3C84_1245570 [compost metagenome]